MLCPKLHITNIVSLAFAPIYHKYLLRLPYYITFSQDAHAGLSCRFVQFISTFPPPSRSCSACLQNF